MEDYDKIKKVLALDFMHFLDKNRPEGKMCLSNGECADIEKAFNEQDWSKLARYLDKYLIDGGSSETPKDLESYAQTVEDYYDVGEERGYLCTHRGDIRNAVIAGAKWQKEQDDKELSEKIASAYQLGRKDEKEQMMKEAVEGTLASTTVGHSAIFLDEMKNGLHFGDKVRIIIVKEN